MNKKKLTSSEILKDKKRERKIYNCDINYNNRIIGLQE